MEHSENTTEAVVGETERERRQFAKMTKTPIPKLVVMLGIPTMLNMMVSSLYNLADTYFVSGLGESATGARQCGFVPDGDHPGDRLYFRHGRRQHHFAAAGQTRPKRSGRGFLFGILCRGRGRRFVLCFGLLF